MYIFFYLDNNEFKYKKSISNYRDPISYKDLDLYNTQPIAHLRQHFFPYTIGESSAPYASNTYRLVHFY